MLKQEEVKKEEKVGVTIQNCLNCDGEGSVTGKTPCELCNGTGKVER